MVEAKGKDSASSDRKEASDSTGGGRNTGKSRSGRKDKKDGASGGAGGSSGSALAGTSSGGGGGGNSKRNKKVKKDAVKPFQKVVIRRLPPSMDEETFRKQIEPIPDHEDFYFVSGDWSLGKNASSRAYISFTHTEDIFLFRDKFDGYIFVDGKGVEYPAVVEYAPFQELPRNRSRKKDAKMGTIELDTHFLAFQEALEAEEKEASGGKSKGKLEYSYTIKDEKRITSTPLLEFIAQKRQEKRDEKRKKLEEKKKQRKEERQKKVGLTGKIVVPEVIKEEDKAKDDDIVVRTVPSRLDPKQGRKDGGKKDSGADKKEDIKEGKEVKEKEKRQRNRGKDKDKEDKRPKQPVKEKEDMPVVEQEKTLSRKQERDRLRREKQKATRQEEREKKLQAEPTRRDSKASVVKPETPVENPAPITEAPKKEVKKYSERRKETRARAENRLAELEDPKDLEESITSDHFKLIPNIPKVDIKKSNLTPHVAPFIPKEKTSTIILGESSLSLPPAFPQKSSTPIPSQLPADEQSEPIEPVSQPQTPSESNSSDKKTAEIESKLQEAREARKLRNKNRPSIEIYQPRKRLQPGSSGTGTNAKSEDEPTKEKSDSDRSSDKSSRPIMSSGGGGPSKEAAGVKEKRHRLTKKASDKERPRDRRNRRKNSSDFEATKDSRKNSRDETTPEDPILEVDKPTEGVSEVTTALEGVKLDS